MLNGACAHEHLLHLPQQEEDHVASEASLASVLKEEHKYSLLQQELQILVQQSKPVPQIQSHQWWCPIHGQPPSIKHPEM